MEKYNKTLILKEHQQAGREHMHAYKESVKAYHNTCLTRISLCATAHVLTNTVHNALSNRPLDLKNLIAPQVFLATLIACLIQVFPQKYKFQPILSFAAIPLSVTFSQDYSSYFDYFSPSILCVIMVLPSESQKEHLEYLQKKVEKTGSKVDKTRNKLLGLPTPEDAHLKEVIEQTPINLQRQMKPKNPKRLNKLQTLVGPKRQKRLQRQKILRETKEAIKFKKLLERLIKPTESIARKLMIGLIKSIP